MRTFDEYREYPARVVDVIDGDTLDIEVDVGFNMTRTIRLRLKGIDTAEMYGVKKDSDEYEAGHEHMDYAISWIGAETHSHGGEWPFIARTYKTGKYGRYIGDLYSREHPAESLVAVLVNQFPEIGESWSESE
ncbi:hypothetical protein DVK00_02795 [Haloarcula sp. Atlit-47R]|uniref:thermonuclease family protein n=1 Tax=Haloarcula sp. Atlit-47R TaxID=2282132 RepID=UPI000EF2663D|nr:hypothetical protein [Haloarcula sp. Atlit-47R]RLM47452.1 hypothetical protein DVK00_02795 [Haloarcula sp. Atlit-47R]